MLARPSTLESFRPAVLIPAFRCEASVRAVVEGVRRYVPDVLVVDDGSGDGTAREAEAGGARVVVRPSNGGKGSAIRDGLSALLATEATHVAFVDADGQHHPDDLPGLLSAARQGADFVIGSRLSNPEGMPARSYWANTIGDKVLSRMTGLPVEDGQSGYRLVSARLLRPLRLVSRRYAIENEILVKACRRVERFAVVPVRSIYGVKTHYRPFHDTWVTSWLTVHYKTTGSDET